MSRLGLGDPVHIQIVLAFNRNTDGSYTVERDKMEYVIADEERLGNLMGDIEINF